LGDQKAKRRLGSRGRLTLLRTLASELLAAGSGARFLCRVAGESMMPELTPGDWLWVNRAGDGLPSVGAVVVVRSPEPPYRLLVKRCVSRGTDSFAVGSDAPATARDSRHFGSLAPQCFVGLCLAVWSPRRGVRRI